MNPKVVARALTVNLQKVFYNSQASVGDRQYTIILFISIIFLPTILNYLLRQRKREREKEREIMREREIERERDRERGGGGGAVIFCRILEPPNAPSPGPPQY